jgi:solute carrier family 35 (UDP-sugar transporter), member A1/2/3
MSSFRERRTFALGVAGRALTDLWGVNVKETLLVLSTVLLAWQTVLYGSVRQAHGFATTLSLTMLFESLKLVISVGLLLSADILPKLRQGESLLRALAMVFPSPHVLMRDTALFFVPAALYLVNENLLFRVLGELGDPLTFEILANLRVITTSGLVTLVFGRELTRTQWVSLVLLSLGTAMSQIVTCGTTVYSDISLSAFFLTLVYCTLSAGAGVFTEFMLKKRFQDSIYVQNIQLHSCGVLLNFALIVFFHSDSVAAEGIWGLAVRDSIHLWIVIVHALSGLTLAALMKFSDNIARVFSHSLSLLLAMVVFSVFYGVVPSVQFLLGVSVVACSLYLFYTEDIGEDSGMQEFVLGDPTRPAARRRV